MKPLFVTTLSVLVFVFVTLGHGQREASGIRNGFGMEFGTFLLGNGVYKESAEYTASV